MKNPATKKLRVLMLVLASLLVVTIPTVFAIGTAIDLGTAEDFAVLAGAAVTDSTPGAGIDIIGDVGLSPTGGTFITGLSCTQVTGTIYDTNAGYLGGFDTNTTCLVTDPGLLTTAKSDLSLAYNDANGQTPDALDADGSLGAGQTLVPGVYSEDGTPDSLDITGELILDGGGDPDAVFIFQTDSTLITASDSTITLIGEAQACNVFWQVGTSATLGTNTTFVGTIMAAVSITDNGGSTVDGRLLADADNTDADSTGAVTLDSTTVTVPTCAVAGAGAGSDSNAFSEDNSCPAFIPPAPQWAFLDSAEGGANLTWSASGGSRVDIEITNSEGEYEYRYAGVSNTGHMFLPNVSLSQMVRIRVLTGCEYGDWLVATNRIGLPNTGRAPYDITALWLIPASILMFSPILLKLVRLRK